MKKTYQLDIPGKNRERLLDAARHDIRRYQQRELRRPLPEGFDFWDFDCRFGASETQAEKAKVAELSALITTLTQDGTPAFYVELVARPAKRSERPQSPRARGTEASAAFLEGDA